MLSEGQELRGAKLAPASDLGEISCIPYLVRLTMSVDAMRGAIRWQLSFKNSSSPEDKADRLSATITALGWVGETVCLLKQGQSGGYVRREMLDGFAEEQGLFDECTGSDPPELVILAHRVRDKCFAHWDAEAVAKPFVKAYVEGETSPLFIESESDGDTLKTCYPWAQEAIGRFLVGDSQQPDAMRKLIENLGCLIGTMLNLAGQLVRAIVKDHGLTLDPCYSRRKGSNGKVIAKPDQKQPSGRRTADGRS